MIVGVNGTGKTTTVGKLARLIKDGGQAPLICAADTFRAAAVEQLEIWATRAGVDFIRARAGADPAAVVFDAIAAGKARNRDVLLVDTAGRLHTRVNLMTELDKIRRIAAREVEGAPHEVLLVLDATVGQNGLAQAREFMAVAGVNGIVLTKLDGTAKGGIAVAIANDLKLPIRYVGVGEGIDDLIPFCAAGVRRRALRGEVVIDDAACMARALLLAERGRGRTSPNPMVGALVVDADGVVVGRGSHERAGGPHAEVHALADAGDRARGATLYCTLEPCAHTGRTGPCAPRVVEAGIRRAVIAVEDPNPLVRGRGLAFLREHGVEVEVGVMAEEATRLNRPFFTFIQRGRPFVTLKAALSLDGMVAARRGARTPLTGPEANALVHQERAEVDALGRRFGDGARRRSAPDRARRLPRPATRARRLRPAPAHASGGATVLDPRRGAGDRRHHGVARAGAPERAAALVAAGAQVEVVAECEGGGEAASAAFLRAALARLARQDVMSLIVEGGPVLHEAFWRAGLVDAWSSSSRRRRSAPVASNGGLFPQAASRRSAS